MMTKIAFSGIVTSLLLTSANAAEDLRSALDQCRLISDADVRLECYDSIGDDAATDVPAAVPAPPPGNEPDADFGLPEKETKYQFYNVTVDRCGQAANRRFYFYFDNGQVWRYLGDKKLRYRNCNLTATVKEDRFGYALQFDNETRFHRIQRVK